MPKGNANINIQVEALAKLFREKHLKLVTAESCTGGGLAYALTQIPGSSQWFERGFVTYSNEAKQALLAVTTIEAFGAVSEETAKSMAEGALQNSLADIAISVTGIAGPDGGTPEKPVGTVCFGLASQHFSTKTFMQHFQGNREEIRQKSIFFAIDQLILCLK